MYLVEKLLTKWYNVVKSGKIFNIFETVVMTKSGLGHES